MATGRFYRSDELSRLTAQDLGLIERLQLKTIIDLRTPNERRAYPDRLPPGSPVRLVNIPILPLERDLSRLEASLLLLRQVRTMDVGRFLQDYYLKLAFERTSAIQAVFSLLADESNQPVLIHCTAGKDRTGYLAALLQLLAGADRTQVMQEYLATNDCLSRRKESYLRTFRRATLFLIPAQRIQPALEARAEYLNGALDAVLQQHGSISAYLKEACGLPVATLDRLARSLIE